MSVAGANGLSTMLRRIIKTIKRSPLLTQLAWRVYQRFPGLGRMVAGRMIRPVRDDKPMMPVMIVSASAWDDSVPSSTHFKQQLAHALQRSEGRQK